MWKGLIALLLFYSGSALLLNDTFDSLDNWRLDLQGNTAYVDIDSGNLITTVSFCGTSCYRAEVSTAIALRSSVLSNTGEYWLGFSNRIPSSWRWLGDTSQNKYGDVTYIFQIHGGDNLGRSPILGIRNLGKSFSINICGNSAYNSPEESCVYDTLGDVTIGDWISWVVHVKLSSVPEEGFVSVWRDQKLVLQRTGLLTSYDDIKPHYIKLGSYQINWKRGETTQTQWVGVDYAEVRVGNETSGYDEVNTGTANVTENTKSSGKGISVLLLAVVVSGAVILSSMCCTVMCGKKDSHVYRPTTSSVRSSSSNRSAVTSTSRGQMEFGQVYSADLSTQSITELNTWRNSLRTSATNLKNIDSDQSNSHSLPRPHSSGSGPANKNTRSHSGSRPGHQPETRARGGTSTGSRAWHQPEVQARGGSSTGSRPGHQPEVRARGGSSTVQGWERPASQSHPRCTSSGRGSTDTHTVNRVSRDSGSVSAKSERSPLCEEAATARIRPCGTRASSKDPSRKRHVVYELSLLKDSEKAAVHSQSTDILLDQIRVSSDDWLKRRGFMVRFRTDRPPRRRRDISRRARGQKRYNYEARQDMDGVSITALELPHSRLLGLSRE